MTSEEPRERAPAFAGTHWPLPLPFDSAKLPGLSEYEVTVIRHAPALPVYTAAKGLGSDAEHNTLQELSGSPESGTWSPEVDTFKDPEHVARASEQETLMSVTRVSLLDVTSKATRKGGTVFSVTPDVRERKAVFVVLLASRGKVQELCAPRSSSRPRSALAPPCRRGRLPRSPVR